MTHTPFSFTRNSPCTGPSRSPSACGRSIRTGDNVLLEVGREAGRRDVDRLLKKRAVERIRLIEHRQRLKRSFCEQPLYCDFDPRHKILGEDPAGLLVPCHQTQIGEECTHATERISNSSSSLARITPQLAERISGFTTQG